MGRSLKEIWGWRSWSSPALQAIKVVYWGKVGYCTRLLLAGKGSEFSVIAESHC